MEWRVPALAVGRVVLGSALLVDPLQQGPTYTNVRDSGQWLDLSVPATESLAGVPVTVSLRWGYLPPPPVCGARNHFEPSPGVGYTYHIVFDCGRSLGTEGGNCSPPGRTGADTGGHALFAALPGHHYPVWWLASIHATEVTSVPVRYSLGVPVLGGVVGGVGLAWGTLAGTGAAWLWQDRKRAKPPSKAVL